MVMRAFQRRAQSVYDPALDLLFDSGGVHDLAAIHGADHAVHAQLAVVHRSLGDLGGEAADIVDQCNTASAAFG